MNCSCIQPLQPQLKSKTLISRTCYIPKQSTLYQHLVTICGSQGSVTCPICVFLMIFFFCHQFIHFLLLMVQKSGKYYVLFAWNNQKQWPGITVLQLLAAPDEGKI